MNRLILIMCTAACFVLSTSALVFSAAKSVNNPHGAGKKRPASVEQARGADGGKTRNMKAPQKTAARKGHTHRRLARNIRTAPPILEEIEDDGEFIEYVAQSGDTVEKVAMKFGVEKDDILESNINVSQLSQGRVLLIPRTGESQAGDDAEDLQAEALKPWKTDQERYMLVKVARSLIGTPYRYGGKSLRGLDSAAFVKKIYDIFDVHLPRFTRDQYKTGPKILRDELSVGDLVFFKTKKNAKYPTHVGIYIGKGNFIHSSPGEAGNGVKIDSLQTGFYDRAYAGATRVKSSSDEAASDTPSHHSARLSKENPPS